MKKFGKWLKAIFSKCTYAAERAYETQLEQHGDHLPPLPPPPPPPQYDLPSLSNTNSDDDDDEEEEQGCDVGWPETLAEYS